MSRFLGRTDELPAVAFVLVALASIVAVAASLPTPIRAPLVLGAIVFGPGALLWRQLTPRPWWECVVFGAAVNVAGVMVLSQLLVAFSIWYPVQAELLVPVTTCTLAWYLGQPSRAVSEPAP